MINVFLERQLLNLELVELEEKPRWASPWILSSGPPWAPNRKAGLRPRPDPPNNIGVLTSALGDPHAR